MSDTTIPATTTTVVTAVPAPAPNPEAGVSVDNAAFARMRKASEDATAQAAAEKARADELAAKLAEIERASMTELDRLKAENAELKPLKDQHGKYETTLQSLYAAEMDAVPEDKKSYVQLLSGSGDWASRLDSLRAAKALIGAAPAPAGTVVQPGRTGVPEVPQQRLDPSKLGWGEAVKMTAKQ